MNTRTPAHNAPAERAGTSGVDLVLVACAKTKQVGPARAGELYVSQRFRGAAKYARRTADRWLILSARHGLLDPEQVIEPYEQTLHRMSMAERRKWASAVARAIQQIVTPPARIEVLAGLTYREVLVPLLETARFEIRVPMAGLRQGEQLRWLKQVHQAHVG